MEMARRRRKAEKLYRVLAYKLQYYEELFPWLIDFTSEDVEDLIQQITNDQSDADDSEDSQMDQARKWLTKAEYDKLQPADRYQLALERYWSKKKSRWEVGRDYERYIGFLYESSGYSV